MKFFDVVDKKELGKWVQVPGLGSIGYTCRDSEINNRFNAKCNFLEVKKGNEKLNIILSESINPAFLLEYTKLFKFNQDFTLNFYSKQKKHVRYFLCGFDKRGSHLFCLQ